MRQQLGLDPLRAEVGTDRWPVQLPTRAAGTSLRPGKPIFPRLDKKQHAEVLARFAAPDAAPPVAEQAADGDDAAPSGADKPTISYEDFAKLDLRIGIVRAASRIKHKDKLLDLKVDVGDGQERQLVAGIAPYYAPEDLVGRRIVVLCNLAPRKFAKKLVSHGMLLAAEAGDAVTLLAVDGELPPGAAIH
jgi:methionyl-tRNA synthetase